jgi:hypothetical protein
VALTIHSHLRQVKERVELYLFSLVGIHGQCEGEVHVLIKTAVFWDIVPYRVVNRYRRLEGT